MAAVDDEWRLSVSLLQGANDGLGESSHGDIGQSWSPKRLKPLPRGVTRECLPVVFRNGVGQQVSGLQALGDFAKLDPGQDRRRKPGF
mmetsp:Transcript_1126/g.2403  ORF Transcript_1126/g.2403 Transcript_1126/m.2403 type:complete len:88 (-) Transcript_1126:1214-1477(-)